MRSALGDGYVEALRSVYPEMADGSDYVLFWWVRAAATLKLGKSTGFGFITTNSITQAMNRRATDDALRSLGDGYGIVFAIADHPWVDQESGAAVRIAMTSVGPTGRGTASLVKVLAESEGIDGQVDVELAHQQVGLIHADLRAGAAIMTAQPLRANSGLCSVALVRFGDGFLVDGDLAARMEPTVVHPILTGRDLNQRSAPRYVIDFYPFGEDEARANFPRAFQHVVEHVRPGRAQIRDAGSRQRWWRFGRDKPELRRALSGTKRYIATSEVSKFRVFVFVDSNVKPDHSLIATAVETADVLGVMSSCIHSSWARAAGGRLGVGNDLRYSKSRCFEPFPFPDLTDTQRSRIANLAEALDAHRKRQQALHPELTITGMYNVLEKLRSGEPLSAKDKVIHEQGLVSVLKTIHDDLDAAVFEAYGWPKTLTDDEILERLVALNKERAEEEARGLVRWLRPDFQAPAGDTGPKQASLPGAEPEADPEDEAPAPPRASKPPTAAPWPKKLPEQIAAVRDFVLHTSTEHTATDVARAFKGAKEEAVADLLESLVALGVAVTYDVEGEKRWRSARALG